MRSYRKNLSGEAFQVVCPDTPFRNTGYPYGGIG